jgi:chromosome segregation ATPase
VERLTTDLDLASERVEFLEGALAMRGTEYKDLEAEFNRAKEERDRCESQYLEVAKELNELKEGRDTWIQRLADVLHKLFGMK